MANESQNLVVEELDQLYGITEEELASASLVCSTCTCTGGGKEEVAEAVSAEAIESR